jgi:hypothetical protein
LMSVSDFLILWVKHCNSEAFVFCPLICHIDLNNPEWTKYTRHTDDVPENLLTFVVDIV